MKIIKPGIDRNIDSIDSFDSIVDNDSLSLTNRDFDDKPNRDRNCENIFYYVNFIFFHY